MPPIPPRVSSAKAGRPAYDARVGFYREQLLPRLVDRACDAAGVREWRLDVTAGSCRGE
jgi:hypothetical protein